MTGVFAAVLSFGSTGAVFRVKPGPSRINAAHNTTVTASATATITWAANRPNHCTNRSEKRRQRGADHAHTENTCRKTLACGAKPVARERNADGEDRAGHTQKKAERQQQRIRACCPGGPDG